MRRRSSIPARQLQSASGRYALACAAWANAPPRRSVSVPAAAAAPVDPAPLARLEAILVLAREPLSSRKLAQYANLADATLARTLIRQLNERYDRRGRAFRVVEVAGGYQLQTRPQFGAWLRRLAHIPSEVRLSSPALETLAVIAYRQPVGRADIEAIRGVSCGELVRQLMERDLVRISGRAEELGRPYLYGTTKRFLQLFGLSSLEDLPRAAVVRQAALPQAGHESRVSTIATACEEDSDVSVTTLAALALDEQWRDDVLPGAAAGAAVLPSISAEDDDDDFEDEDDDDDDDDDDDLDDLDDEEDDDLDDEDDDDFDDEDDLDDEEWEEVDDEEDLEEDDEDDLDDDDDDDDDDWDDDEEEEEDDE